MPVAPDLGRKALPSVAESDEGSTLGSSSSGRSNQVCNSKLTGVASESANSNITGEGEGIEHSHTQHDMFD